MKTIYFLFFTILLIAQACQYNTTITNYKDSIPQEIKEDITVLDKKVTQSLSSNNKDLLTTIMSDSLLSKSEVNLSQFLQRSSSIMKTPSFTNLNQFHIKNTASGINNTILSGMNELNDYTINYKAINKEVFISLMTVNNGLDEFLITAVYEKYPKKWQLNVLQFRQYKINGKTAPELFEKAKTTYDKGHLMDAANIGFLGASIKKPAHLLWTYHKEDEMNAFNEKLKSEINSTYIFPMTLSEIYSKPKISNIYPQVFHEGYVPTVEYLTQININDTLKTKVENRAIHKLIGEKIKGIDEDNKFIAYKAFNKIPDGTSKVPYYGFVKEIK